MTLVKTATRQVRESMRLKKFGSDAESLVRTSVMWSLKVGRRSILTPKDWFRRQGSLLRRGELVCRSGLRVKQIASDFTVLIARPLLQPAGRMFN